MRAGFGGAAGGLLRARLVYSRWDGTQAGLDLDAGDLLGRMTDDLLYHGDLDAAMKRLLQAGYEMPDGRRVQGLREMLERLRQRRREELARRDLGSVHEDLARRLREVMDVERAAVRQAAEQADLAGDRRRLDTMATRRMQLDLVPPGIAGRIRALQRYDFFSGEARQRFDELLDELRREVLQSHFDRLSSSLSDPRPEMLERFRQMLDALNRMIESRDRGEALDPGFEDFMDRFGDMFPDRPATLAELLEQMARRMAAMSSLLSSMNPEQRRQLQELADGLLADMDLGWQVGRLGANLRSAFPGLSWDRRRPAEGMDPLGLAEATGVMEALSDIDELENLLRFAASPGALADVDLDRVRDLLGDEAAESLERLADLARRLVDAGLIEQREGRQRLTPRGMRKIGTNALAEVFSRLQRSHLGPHPTTRAGIGHEREQGTKPYEHGDPFNLDIEQTLRNALWRRGPGVPVELAPADFEVERTERLTSASTVLLIDLSLSMPMRDNFLAAKKVAMALHSLISTSFPRDYLGLVGFSEVARELSARELPEVSWDFVYGTNVQHALTLARRQLSRRGGSRQVLLITDGEPTAHIAEGGEVFFNYPPVPETVEATLREVLRCTREGIRINTFMLDATPHLRDFVERLTRLNRGRAFFTTPENLGDYVLVDFLEQKRSVRAHGSAGIGSSR